MNINLSGEKNLIKVSIVTETYPPEINGVANTISRFVKELIDLGHEITLIRPRQYLTQKPEIKNSYKEVLTYGLPIPGYKSLKLGLPQKKLLLNEWNLNRPNLVHIVTEGPLGWAALEAARELDIPVCSDFRTNFDTYSQHYGISWLKKPIINYLRNFHNKTQFTMVPTETLKIRLQSQGFERLKVVSRGIDTNLFSPKKRKIALRKTWGIKNNQKVVLYVGRLASEKNLIQTVTTFKAMQQMNRNLKMVWVGDGPLRGALEQSCPDSIFAGLQTGDNLATYYASGDIFLFSSLTETFGNVTLEAMASGLIVLAYDYAAANIYIKSGENGFLANPKFPELFTNSAIELLNSNKKWKIIKNNARETILNLSWKNITENLIENYYDLLIDSYKSANSQQNEVNIRIPNFQ